MYFIINITRPPKEVYIEDLNFYLGPNKAIDLEKHVSLKTIRASKDLKRLIKSKNIQLRQTTKVREQTIEKAEKTESTGLAADDIKKITQSVVQELSKNQTQSQQSNITPELLSVLKDLKDTMVNNQRSDTSVSNFHVKEKDVELDFDRLSDIHARSVAKQSKQIEGKVDYQEKEVDTKASSNADELGDLLG